MAHLLQRFEPAWRGFNHAAGAEQRLGDNGGRTACRLGVEKLKARFQASKFAARESLIKWTSVAIRSDYRVCAPGKVTMPGVPPRKRHGACGVRKTVETDVRAGDLETTGIFPGNHHSHFVRVGAGLSEESFLQGSRHNRAETRRQLYFLHIVVARMRVKHGIARVFNGSRDARMIMPKRSAHLT